MLSGQRTITLASGPAHTPTSKILFSQLPTGDRAANQLRAIDHLQAALRVYNEIDYPVDWAAVQQNLGSACSQLRAGEREANLQRAISHYEASLRVFTRESAPLEWAKVHSNIGSTLANLAGEPQSNRKLAIEHLMAALTVYTEIEYLRISIKAFLALPLPKQKILRLVVFTFKNLITNIIKGVCLIFILNLRI